MVDIKDIIEQNIAIKRKMVEVCIEPIEKAADLMIDAIMNGKKILWCGNGGSAADAHRRAGYRGTAGVR